MCDHSRLRERREKREKRGRGDRAVLQNASSNIQSEDRKTNVRAQTQPLPVDLRLHADGWTDG